MVPRVISIYGIDGFYATIATQRETGLQKDIFMECEAAKRFEGTQPYVFAASDDWLYPISISSSPVLIDDIGYETNDFTEIFSWIADNRDLLLYALELCD